MAPSASGVESYIEVWVTGSFTTAGSGYILQQPGAIAGKEALFAFRGPNRIQHSGDKLPSKCSPSFAD